QDVVGDLARQPVGRDESDRSRPKVLPAEAEADAVHIDVAAVVDRDLVPALAERAQVGMGHKGTVALATQKSIFAGHEQPAVRQEVDAVAGRLWSPGDDLAAPGQFDGSDLLRPPVAEPQPAVVPARRLANDQAGDQGLHFSHFSHADPSYKETSK